MAENTVVKETLTDQMIKAGAELTVKLDEIGLPITAALWLYLPDTNEWRLFFATDELSIAGPRVVYEKIEAARHALGDKAAGVPLSAIGVIDSKNELVQLLTTALRTGAGISPIRFSKNVINGHFIDDALIYRVN